MKKKITTVEPLGMSKPKEPSSRFKNPMLNSNDYVDKNQIRILPNIG